MSGALRLKIGRRNHSDADLSEHTAHRRRCALYVLSIGHMRLQALTSHLDNQRIEVGGAKGIGVGITGPKHKVRHNTGDNSSRQAGGEHRPQSPPSEPCAPPRRSPVRPRVVAGAVRACATAPGDDSPAGTDGGGGGGIIPGASRACMGAGAGSADLLGRNAPLSKTVIEIAATFFSELALDRLAAEQPYLRCLNRRRRRLRLEGLAYDCGTRSRRHRPTVTGDSGNLCTLTRRTDRHDPSRPRLGDLQQRDHRTALYGLAPQTRPIQISGTIGLDNHHNMKR